MRCFYYADAPLQQGERVDLGKDLRHHLERVLRLSPGEELQLFDGRGTVADAILRDDGRAEVKSCRTFPPPRSELTLIQGLPKGDKVELILQKGTELGVSRFILVPMTRSVARLKQPLRQQERWSKIVSEAARQCRQYHLPEVHISESFAQALAMVADAQLKLLLWEDSDRPLAEVVTKSEISHGAVIVGPEGGISKEEAALAGKQGCVDVRLGGRILRTETAGLAIVAVLQYLYGDLSGRLVEKTNLVKDLRGKDRS